MRKFVERFVEYPIYANLAILFVVLAGIFSYASMRKVLFPGNGKPIYQHLRVITRVLPRWKWKKGLPRGIEEAVRGLIGIKEITSTSVENRSTVSPLKQPVNMISMRS